MRAISIFVSFLLLAAWGQQNPAATTAAADVSEHTLKTNRTELARLPDTFEQDVADARRGWLASAETMRIESAAGAVIWDLAEYQFMDTADIPPSAHPALWQQEQLNNIHGLFEVADGVYQLRGFDLANITLIRTDNGYVLVDPLTSAETSSKALALAESVLGTINIHTVIYSHSHVDHFGGVLGVVDADQLKAGDLQIIAPEGFMEEATSENAVAGVAMTRRADYMYGRYLDRSETGHIGSGLGKSPALGTIGLLPPTRTISAESESLNIDGVDFVFRNIPGAEAPAELVFYLPEQKLLCGAELVSRTLHNLYTLRGAKVRDALQWAAYIDELMREFPDAEVLFNSHHWPVWGPEAVQEFLAVQRDSYKFIHDQTVRLFNQGLGPRDIADQLKWPDALREHRHNRGYYGTLRHNSKAVYQRYLGWYDGNPAKLNPLPESQTAGRYIKLMGGGAAVYSAAQTAYEQGDYRWAAELLDRLVQAEPSNTDARGLLKNSYQQLGYQAESAPWRDAYLSAARELEAGPPVQGLDLALYRDVLRHASPQYLFTTMATRVMPEKADGKAVQVLIEFTDLKERYLLSLERTVLHHRKLDSEAGLEPDVSLRMTWSLWLDMALKTRSMTDILSSDDLNIDGSRLSLLSFFSTIEFPEGKFPLVPPQ